MSISKPKYLFVFNEASGKAITNYGSVATSYAIATQATEATDFSWHQNAGPFSPAIGGYLNTLTVGSHEAYLSTAATGPGNTLTTINFACGFRFHSGTLTSGTYCFLVSPKGSTGNGDLQVSLIAPSGGGNFDLHVQANNGGGANTIIPADVTGLLVDTDYIFSCSIDPTTSSAVVSVFKFGASAAVTPATANWTSFDMDTNYPYILRRSDFTNYFCMNGRLNFWAYDRGGPAWNATDLATINADPTQITGWPTAGGGGSNAPLADRSAGGMETLSGGMFCRDGEIMVPDRELILPPYTRRTPRQPTLSCR